MSHIVPGATSGRLVVENVRGASIECKGLARIVNSEGSRFLVQDTGNPDDIFMVNSRFATIDLSRSSNVGIQNTRCNQLVSDGSAETNHGTLMDIEVIQPSPGSPTTSTDYSIEITGAKGLILKVSAGQEGVNADGGIHLDTCVGFEMEGVVQLANRHGVFLENCTHGEDRVQVRSPSRSSNNGFQGKRYTNTHHVKLAGGVQRAASGNGPNYGAQIDADCTDIEIAAHLANSGATAEINNLAGFEVWTHAKVSTETPADGDVLVWDDANQIFRPDDGSGVGGGGTGAGATVSQLSMASFSGELVTYVGTFRMVFPIDATIVGVTAAVGVAPTDDDVIVDVHKNGTTIFTTQANRPTITDGTNISAHEVPDVTAVTAGEYLTFDVDQIGSTLPGEDLTVIVEWRMA